MQSFFKLIIIDPDIFKDMISVFKHRALRHQIDILELLCRQKQLESKQKKMLSFNFAWCISSLMQPLILYPKIQEPAATPAITDLTVHFQKRKLLRQNLLKWLVWLLKYTVMLECSLYCRFPIFLNEMLTCTVNVKPFHKII